MADDTVAFVQTPQVHGNLHTTIARGAAYMQSMFYRYVQPGRNEFNAAFCVGTNVLFRRKAVKEIGGMYTGSKSEDVWTSLLLHERGWKSLFLPQTLAIGEAQAVEAYSKQQLRCRATGGFEILLTHNPFSPRRRRDPGSAAHVLRHRRTLPERHRHWRAAVHVPALGIRSGINMPRSVRWSGRCTTRASTSCRSCCRPHPGHLRPEVLLLSAASFPIYIKAFRNALYGIDVEVVGHRHHGRTRIGVQLHHAAGADLRLPARPRHWASGATF